jgi:hypothetical protein
MIHRTALFIDSVTLRISWSYFFEAQIPEFLRQQNLLPPDILNSMVQTTEQSIGQHHKTTPNQVRRTAKNDFQKIGKHKIPISSIRKKIFRAIHGKIQIV